MIHGMSRNVAVRRFARGPSRGVEHAVAVCSPAVKTGSQARAGVDETVLRLRVLNAATD